MRARRIQTGFGVPNPALFSKKYLVFLTEVAESKINFVKIGVTS